MHPHKARAFARDVERRTLTQPGLPTTPEAFVAELRAHLVSAADRRILRTAPHEVFRLLKADRQSRPGGATVISIFGGEPFDKGQTDGAFFVRRDGASFSFTTTAIYTPGQPPELHSYRVHLQFPMGCSPSYIRFDLNRGLGDPLYEPRSHIHVGAEKIRVAAPQLSPAEALSKVLYGIPRPIGAARFTTT